MLRTLVRRRSFSTRSLGTLCEDDVKHFRSVLRNPSAAVLRDPDTIATYNKDWMGLYEGHSTCILRPESTSEVASILSHCNSRMLGVVPQGGNTGLVGGSVPCKDEVILSLSRMKSVHSFDPISGVLVCDAGCVLQSLHDHLAEFGFVMPIDLGARGTCQIGGNVATNAGGIHFVRHGSLHGSVLGLEAVLADGTVLDNLNCLAKDNTGYDLKQLLIGSEGTLGVITKVAIAVPRMPSSFQCAFVACESFEAVQQTLCVAHETLGETLHAFEFMDRQCLDLVCEHIDGARDPFPGDVHPFYCLVEAAGSCAEHDMAKVNSFVDALVLRDIVTDGTVAQDPAQRKRLWQLREDITLALNKVARETGAHQHKYDVSLPLSAYYGLVEAFRERFETHQVAGTTVYGFGHVGDCNLHLNMLSLPEADQSVEDLVVPFVYDFIRDVNGSISAEHGIGRLKQPYLHYSKSEAMVSMMTKIKSVFDPSGILNPGKVLR